MSAQGQSSRTAPHALVLLANDAVHQFAAAFLRSFRDHNPDFPIVVIPFDDDMDRIAALADPFDFSFADYDFAEIDAFARAIFPFTRRKYRRRLRKLAAFDLPYDEIVYLDVDTVALQDFTPLLGLLEPGRTEFVYASLSSEWVYKPGYRSEPRLAEKPLFSDGFFVTSRRYLTTADVMATVRAHKKLYTALRPAQVFCQPVVNFAVHMNDLKTRAIDEVSDRLSPETFFQSDSIRPDNGGFVDAEGRQVLFIHWAGVESDEARKDPRFGALWRKYGAGD